MAGLRAPIIANAHPSQGNLFLHECDIQSKYRPHLGLILKDGLLSKGIADKNKFWSAVQA
jgi:hypothetical protein